MVLSSLSSPLPLSFSHFATISVARSWSGLACAVLTTFPSAEVLKEGLPQKKMCEPATGLPLIT